MDLGIHGQVFEIEEQDMLMYIKNKISSMEANGEIQEHQQLMQKKVNQYVNRPKMVNGIGLATEDRRWEFDPTYRLKEDIKDHNGVLIHAAGKEINPLDLVSLDQPLIFIDGDKHDQVKFALSEENPKIILVKGSPVELMKTHNTRIYFDQKGILVSRFKIKNVPAIAQQDGRKILLREVALNEN